MNIANLHFLVAEDQKVQRSVVVAILASLGATCVFEATDGQAALDIILLQHEPIDIVITDLAMPGMDGIEFIRHLGEAKIRVSIMVASASESSLIVSAETVAASYGIPILGTISKPATAQQLARLIYAHEQAPEE